MQKVDEARIHTLRDAPDRTGPVIYWMSRDQRAQDNWAMLYAQQEAIRRRTALVVVFCLVPCFLDATDRHIAFMLQGLAETAQALARVAIPFFCLKGDPGKALLEFAAESKAALLVTDFDPLRIKEGWRNEVAKAVDCLFVEVDAHNIVPFVEAILLSSYVFLIACHMVSRTGQDTRHPQTVVALDDDTGKVGRDSIEHHAAGQPSGVPKEEESTAGQDDPVDGFSATRLRDEPLKVLRIPPSHACLREATAEPGGAVRQEVLPAPHAENALVDTAMLLPSHRSEKQESRREP